MDTLSYLLGKKAGGGSEINNQSKTANPSTSLQEITPDEGYTGLSKVTINGVTSSIDNNIQAGNIKKDVSILGVTGTYEPTSEPNIFVQTTQPTIKNGIWVESDLTYDKVVIDDDVYNGFEWSNTEKMTSMPNNLSTTGYSAFNSTDTYYITPTKTLYKYNNQTKEWSNLLGYTGEANPSSMAVSDDYLVYTTSGYRKAYIYDIANGTLNSSYNIDGSYSFNNWFGSVIVGNYLYCFGKNNGGTKAKKMDLTTGTVTQLNTIDDFDKCKACYVGDNIIYLFLENKKVYAYNINSNSYTYVTTTQYQLNRNQQSFTVSKLGDYLYFPPSEYDEDGADKKQRGIYRYNLLTDEDELIAEVQSNNPNKNLDYVDYLHHTLIDNDYIIFGGWYFYTDSTNSENDRTTKTLSPRPKTYSQDSLIIQNGNEYSTQFYENDFEGRLLTPFRNVYLYNNDTLYANLPTYVGNGTIFTKIKG